MKRMRFEELLLASRSERAARRLPFHPQCTVLKGDNGTGKSSVIKSLYRTLGATPPNIHPRWEALRPVSSLKFTIDADRFRMLHHDGRYALFDGDDQLMGSYASVTTELGPKIAEMFDFRLLLNTHGGVEQQATPAFLFLPFYLDQDQGWTQKLNSFARLQQFRQPKKDVIDFHFGIRPSAYYEAKSQLSEMAVTTSRLGGERAALQGVLNDLDAAVGAVRVTANLDGYREEIERLLERSQALASEEDQFRERMATAYAKMHDLRDQLAIAESALQEARADREFALGLDGDTIRCPTCHAEYQNGFAERFSIAADEDSLLALAGGIREQLPRAERECEQSLQLTQGVRSRAAEVQAILEVTREQIALQDVLRSEGKREVVGVMQTRLRSLDQQIGALDARARAVREQMNNYDSRERRQTIIGFYAAEMERLLARLSITGLSTNAVRQPAAVLNETGSSLCRAILAFYLASVRTISRHGTCAICPLVVDSPRQQDLDEGNWTRVRECLRDECPEGTQRIIALSDDDDTDFGGSVVSFERPGAVLLPETYESAMNELRPLIESSLRD